MEKIDHAEGKAALLAIMQAAAQPGPEGERRFALSIEQLVEALKEKYPYITAQKVHMLCRSLVGDKQIWCVDRGDVGLDKSKRVLTFGIVEPSKDLDATGLGVVERATIMVSKLSAEIESSKGRTGPTSIGSREKTKEIHDIISELLRLIPN